VALWALRTLLAIDEHRLRKLYPPKSLSLPRRENVVQASLLSLRDVNDETGARSIFAGSGIWQRVHMLYEGLGLLSSPLTRRKLQVRFETSDTYAIRSEEHVFSQR